jgi:hypothetical protein
MGKQVYRTQIAYCFITSESAKSFEFVSHELTKHVFTAAVVPTGQADQAETLSQPGSLATYSSVHYLID